MVGISMIEDPISALAEIPQEPLNFVLDGVLLLLIVGVLSLSTSSSSSVATAQTMMIIKISINIRTPHTILVIRAWFVAPHDGHVFADEAMSAWQVLHLIVLLMVLPPNKKVRQPKLTHRKTPLRLSPNKLMQLEVFPLAHT